VADLGILHETPLNRQPQHVHMHNVPRGTANDGDGANVQRIGKLLRLLLNLLRQLTCGSKNDGVRAIVNVYLSL